jgi:hypothetical protein
MAVRMLRERAHLESVLERASAADVATWEWSQELPPADVSVA